HELLVEHQTDEPSREDVLAVLGRLDPPEAYLPEESSIESITPRSGQIRQVVRSVHERNSGVSRASALLGLGALVSALLLIPAGWMIAIAFQSLILVFVLCGGAILTMLVSGVLGIVLGSFARKSGTWALVGIVTSVLAMVFAIFICATLFQML